MASLRKMRNKWYARLVIHLRYDKLTKKQYQKEILIPFYTKSKTTAKRLMLTLEKYEDDIKSGNLPKNKWGVKLWWLWKGDGSAQMEDRLMDVIPVYLEYRKCVVRKGSAERDGYALKQLTKCLGEDKLIRDLNYKDIEQEFIPFYQQKGYSNSGLNISMRTLKIFFNYLVKEKIMPEPMIFKMLPEEDTECYLNRAEINALHNAVDEKWKRWFYFYEMVGCRASDPFLGFVDGNIWKITPEEVKSKHWHYYQLTDELKYIWMEMQDLKQSYLDKGKSVEYAVRQSYLRVSEKMRKTIKQLRKDGLISKGKKLTLKSFRHTYGIIDVVKNKDIWATSKKLNHAEIGVTQDYLDIEHYIIAQDFPELKPYLNLVDNTPKLQGEPNPDSAKSSSPLHGAKMSHIGYTYMDTKDRKRFSS